jgi:hypothetical protein
MDGTKIFRHKDYELHCGARALAGGKFFPTLVVARQRWPSRPRTIDVQRGDHASVDAAVEAARAQGIEWVSHYG